MTYRSVRLGEVVQLSPKLEPSDLPSSGIVAFLSMADVGENGTILDVQRRPVSEVTKGYTSFRNGDVLLAKITPCFENGKAALVEGLFSEVGFGSTEFHVLRPTDEIDARYLFRLISNARFRSLGRSRMTGSAGQKRLPTGFLKDLIVSLPSLTDQRSIAYILEKADHLCNKRELSISLVDSFLRSVFLEMFGDPATNPKKWPIGSIRDLVSSANYGTSKKASVAEGRYPILRMNNITFSGRIDLTSLKYVDLDPSEESKYLAIRGDLLFNRTNSKELVGKTSVYESDEPMAIAGYLIRVRTNESGNPYYLSAFLNSTYGKQLLQSQCKSIIGMANINAQELQDIEIMLPPRSLQDEYAEVVKRTRAVEARLNASLENVKVLYASLSQRLLA